MTRTAGAPIGCQRPSRFWGLGCPKIYHEAEDTLGLKTCWGRIKKIRIHGNVSGFRYFSGNTAIFCSHIPWYRQWICIGRFSHHCVR
ncbi:hypothetical protein [Thiolapillus sp.]|uniref:hypothetical protein n=1 Tax=Thiolapillus sp. TaxID=2017437 RepID=UPI0025F3DDFE|nr:hypothetical protein [Thiolapillus sp.]